MEGESYDKNGNPIKKYKSKEWPFKTKKEEAEARKAIYEESGNGSWYFEGWNPRLYRRLPWIMQFHKEYKQFLKYRRNNK